MTTEKPSQNVAMLRLRPKDVEERIRAIAADTANIYWTNHARERMRKRDIPIQIATRIIREGYVDGKIEPGQSPGEYKTKLVRNVKGNREAGVVVLVLQNTKLLVKTVEWEDIK